MHTGHTYETRVEGTAPVQTWYFDFMGVTYGPYFFKEYMQEIIQSMKWSR